MLLFLLAYLGGVLTILSPCILPVLPFVFARSDRPFVSSGLPLLAGMAATFAIVATLGSALGNWAVQASQIGRWLALALLAVFGLALLLPALSERLTRPLVRLGGRLAPPGQQAHGGAAGSLVLGAATGLLWAPCAGPILALVLAGGAVTAGSASQALLLLAYALGAATSLAVALLAGRRVFGAMKSSLHAVEWVRRGLGVLVLVGVAAIALGLDTGLLARLSTAQTASLEQVLKDRLVGRDEALAEGSAMPALDGAVQWLNSPPLTPEALKGKVVLVDFWTYSCINCLRTLPYVKAWADKYRDQGLVVIGVHAPEFAFEKDPGNVARAVKDLGIDYPVALDNDYAIWNGFHNLYWPAHYFFDATGKLRDSHFGEGDYAKSELTIQSLLREAGLLTRESPFVDPQASGAEAAATVAAGQSPETYVGYARAQNFAAPGGQVRNAAHDYAAAPELQPDQWTLQGPWTVRDEDAELNGAGGSIAYRFHARDLHLVLGPGGDGRPVRFRVTLDGQAPGPAAGGDIDADGNGTVTEQRLYQLIRQDSGAATRSFRIEFLDPGVHAYAFTFG